MADQSLYYASTGIDKFLSGTNWYEIRILEPIDSQWADWFEGMKIYKAKNGETILSGQVVDQSALHGLLGMIGELNLTLLSIHKRRASNLPKGENHEK
jgi:hypothetical protein